MRITLKLYATLAEYLPAGATNNSITIDLPPPASPHHALDLNGVPRARAHLLLVNGTYIPPEQRDDGSLQEGDVVAAWPPVAGG